MEREAVTIRFPVNLIKQAKQLKDGGESFNELVVEALEREVKRRKTWAAHEAIEQLVCESAKRKLLLRSLLQSTVQPTVQHPQNQK